MMVELEEDAPEADKRRRLNAVMREGRALLREYRRAEDLYVVRHVMLEAARRLLALGEPISRDEVVSLARKIVEADPPPEWRFSADLLLTQMRAAQAADDPERVRSVLDEFVQTYREGASRSFTAKAYMQAAEMAESLGAEKAYADYLDVLDDEYSWEPGVVQFLMSHGQAAARSNEPFVASLHLMDGRTLLMPQDTFHLTVALLFWSAEDERSLDLMDRLQETYQRYRDMDFLVVGINMDDTEDEALVRDTLKEKGVTWPQVFSGKGLEDSVAVRYGIRQVPGVWIVAAMGQTDYKPGHRGMMWKEIGPRIQDVLEHDQRIKLRQWDLRSGLFRAEALLRGVIQEGAVPADRLAELLDALFLMHLSPYLPERARDARSIQGDVRDMLSEHPDSRALRAVEMTLLQYRALVEEDPQLGRQALAIAADFMEAEDTPPHLRALCDYLLIRGELADSPDAHLLVDERVRQFRDAYEKTAPPWLVHWLRFMLWVELGGPGWTVPMMIGLGNHAERGDGAPRSRGMRRGALGKSVLTGKPFHARLEKSDGSTLELPEDLLGSFYTLRFWTTDYPPDAEWAMPLPPDQVNDHVNKLTPRPGDGYEIVGINLDADKEAARRYAEEHYPNWIHTYVGPDRTHSLVHDWDIQALPSTWFVLDDGTLRTHDHEHRLIGGSPPLRGAGGKARDAAKMPMEDVEQWEEAFAAYRDALRRFRLHGVLELTLTTHWWRQHIKAARQEGVEAAEKLLAKGLELNRRSARRHREALEELLPRLELSAAPQANDQLRKAVESLREFRRAEANLEAIAAAARETARWVREDFPAEKFIVAPPEPPDLPDDFPELTEAN